MVRNHRISSGKLKLQKKNQNDLANIQYQHLRDPNTVIIGHLDINSFQNKYEMVVGFYEHFNIILISESKLDITFPDKYRNHRLRVLSNQIKRKWTFEERTGCLLLMT